MPLKTNYALSDAVATLPADKSYIERLLAIPSLSRLWVPDPTKMTFSGGKIVSFRDLVANEAMSITEALAPVYNNVGFTVLPSVQMAIGKRLEGASTINAEDNFTMFWCGKFTADAGGTAVACSIRQDATNQVFIGLNSLGKLRFSYGSGFMEMPGDVEYGKTYAVVGSISGTTVKMWVNGVRMTDGTMAVGASASAKFCIGTLVAGSSTGAMIGEMAATGHFAADVMSNAEFLDVLKGFAREFNATIA